MPIETTERACMTLDEFYLGAKMALVLVYILGLLFSFLSISKDFKGQIPVQWWGLILLCVFWPISVTLAFFGMIKVEK
jgi:hypothetical protein